MSKAHKKRHQFSFELDPELQKRVQRIAQQLKKQGITQAHIGRVALDEKVTEMEQQIANGEPVTISIQV